MRDRPVVSAPTDETARVRRLFRCAHAHEWEMLHGDARRCPTCGTITFEATNVAAIAALARREGRDDGRPSVGAGT